MGLLDILNGMANGPRAPETAGQDGGKSDGMSPMTMAILALLAYKAMKHFGGNDQQSPDAQRIPSPQPGTTTASTGGIGDLLNGSGGLGGLLKGGLGGLLAGGAAGSILSGGLGDLVKTMQQKGLGDTANSWVSNGPNKQIDSNDLANALGSDQINALTSRTGMSRDELLGELSRYLPEVVNDITPDGRLPTDSEISRWL